MLRGLLGDGAPLRASSMQRLTEDWQLDDAQWQAVQDQVPGASVHTDLGAFVDGLLARERANEA